MNTRRFNADLLNDPFFIGFDSIFDKLNHTQTNISNYPPYNLIKTGDDTFLIELAVAGFDEDDFDIELHDGILTIQADVKAQDATTNYLHKGIAARNFIRKFTLADTVQVTGVSLHQGMLTVQLHNVIPEEKKPKKIPISKGPELLTE
jgi:molecular chaperone IbpA